MEKLMQKLQADMLGAMKSKDSLRADILRLVISEIKTEQINTGQEVKPERIFKIMQSNVNAMKEAAEQYSKIGNKEAKKRELAQIAILGEYMPEMMSEDEVEKVVTEVIKNVGASSMQDLGKVMSEVMPKLAGKADGATIQQIVRAKLTA